MKKIKKKLYTVVIGPQSAIDQRKLNEEVDFAKIVVWLAEDCPEEKLYSLYTIHHGYETVYNKLRVFVVKVLKL
jgi:hypothetical protein